MSSRRVDVSVVGPTPVMTITLYAGFISRDQDVVLRRPSCGACRADSHTDANNLDGASNLPMRLGHQAR